MCEVKQIECPDCEEGKYYVDTSSSCMVVRGECCGGCGYSVECETCNGTGYIEEDEE
jgi:hypothetical protein